MIDQAFPIGEIIEKGILEIDKMDWGLVECMTDIGETKQPRLSEYCPVCKKLMKFSKGIGHYCCHGDSGLLYNPKSGEAYDVGGGEVIQRNSTLETLGLRQN